MVEPIQQQQQKDYNIEFILPPSPTTERGYKCCIMSHQELQLFGYCTSNMIVLKSIKNLNESYYFSEHKAKTTACQFNPKLKQVASGDEEGNLIIWDITNFKVIKVMNKILSSKIIDIAWTIDGERICIVGEGKQTVAKVFSVSTESLVGNLQSHSKTLLAVDFKPNKPFKLLLGGEDQIITCYDGIPFKFTKSIKSHSNYVNCIKFDQKGERFISVSSDKQIIIYDTETGEEIKKIQNGHENSIMSCCWFNNLQNEDIFITASCDKQLKLWEAKSGSLLKTLKVVKDNPSIEDQQLGVTAIKNSIISVSFSGKMNIWQDLEISKSENDLPSLFYIGHQSQVNSIIYLETSNSFVSADISGRIIFWEENKIAQRYLDLKSSKKLILSQNGEFLYNLLIDSQIVQISTNSQEILKQVKIQNKKTIDFVCSKSNSIIFYVLCDDNTIQKYDNFNLVQETKLNNIQQNSNISAFDISSNDQYAFIGDDIGNVYKVCIQSGKCEVTLDHYYKKITSIKVSSDDKFLVVGDNAQNIKLWDNIEYKVMASNWSYHSAKITSLNFSYSNKYIVSSSIDCRVYVWNIETLSKEIEIPCVHNKGVSQAIFDKKGRIITAGGDNLVKIISINNKQIL